MNNKNRRLPLQGLAIRVLVGADDAKGQAIPFETQRKFRSWRQSEDVPAGEFHLATSRIK